MNILGLIFHESFGHPSACILQNGKLLSFMEEERLVRVKQAKGYFPIQSIKFCLKEAKFSLKDIDIIAFGWDANDYKIKYPLFLGWSFIMNRVFKTSPKLSDKLLQRESQGAAIIEGIKDILATHPKNLSQVISQGLREAGFIHDKIPPIKYINHHLSHAASAFYCSGLEESAILVADGHGEESTITIWKGNNKNVELIKKWSIPNSLGWFYSMFTEYLGWDPNEGEVKLMGLAPYGRYDKEINNIINEVLILSDNNIQLNTKYLFYNRRSFGRFYSDFLVEKLGFPRGKDEPITDKHRNIAFAVQHKLEEAGLMLAKLALKLTDSKNLCFAGGVALNCKLNGVIDSQEICSNFFVQPLSYDAGASIGAAMVVAASQQQDPRFHMEHLYYGPQFSALEISETLSRNLLKYRTSTDPALEAAQFLAKGKIVGWFQGRMEAGARALGNRSILGDPRDPKMAKKINDKVKFREDWRPFALSVLEEASDQYLENACTSPFMAKAYKVPQKMQINIVSALHNEDQTTRPQTVNKEINLLYWNLINHFYSITNIPCVLNTSFNIKGDPIVCTPDDAIKTFYSTGIEVLIIGPFILEKEL
jgi:carbamoyltransferase